MKVTWSWLNDWVDLPGTPEELAHLFAMRGLPVQSLERGGSLDPAIIVGEVVEAARHPNADRLTLCTVDVGTARLSIVCGAPNVAAGQRVAVAQIGARLPDGTKLRRTKIRGVESEGMICSERELGLSEESQGIWVLPGKPAIGTPVAGLVGSQETMLDVEITSNRTDCMAVVGLAREIASARNVALKPPRPVEAKGAAAVPTVTIENPADCPRYMARVVRGIRVGPSPDWLRRRLEAAGFRSINNVVDATNYVLREYGQPIHAFDAAKVGGNAIRVRRARAGERLRLLDGKDVTLQPSHLVIADSRRPMALAGVMGGLESGVTDGTTSVVLESAQFQRGVDARDGAVARHRERRRGALRAGSRSGRGRGRARCDRAAPRRGGGRRGFREPRRSVAGSRRGTRGRALPGTVERAPGTPNQRRDRDPKPSLPRDRIGGAMDAGQRGVGGALSRPLLPADLEIEEDLIEEVGRVIGYDAIPGRLRAVPSPLRRSV